MADEIEIEILEDGTIKVTTPTISAASHRNADEFMKLLKEYMGGEVQTEKHTRGQVQQDNENRARQQ